VNDFADTFAEKEKAERSTRPQKVIPLTEEITGGKKDAPIIRPPEKESRPKHSFNGDFSMPQGFIKTNRSPEMYDLLVNEPDCFLLLTLVAVRAKRQDLYSNKKLLPGQALIGSDGACGLTRQRYRDSVQKLKDWGLCSFQSTNHGTIATLLDNAIYDINLLGRTSKEPAKNQQKEPAKEPADFSRKNEEKGQQKNQQNFEEQNQKRTTNKNKEIKKERIKENITKEKINFRDWVKLTQEEHDSLIQKNGEIIANQMLDALDSYNHSREKHYVSDYGALKKGGWVHKKILSQGIPVASPKAKGWATHSKKEDENDLAKFIEAKAIIARDE